MPEDTVHFIPKGLIISCKDGFTDEGAIRTYSKRLFMISEKVLEGLAKKEDCGQSFKNLRFEGKYSAREEHGGVMIRDYRASGVELLALFDELGFSDSEKNGNVTFAASNHETVLACLSSDRYRFGNGGVKEKVPPILAFEYRIEDSKRNSHSVTVRNKYPRLFFGQRSREDVNQCSFIKEVDRVEPEGVPPAVEIYCGNSKWSAPSLAYVVSLQPEMRSFEINGILYTCHGLDLYTLISKSGLQAENIEVFNKHGKSFPIDNIKAGNYLLTWYSEDLKNKTPCKNSTELKLYGEGFVIDDVKSITCPALDAPDSTLPLKMPDATVQELTDSIFYCAVETPEKRLVYYFSERELTKDYPQRQETYSYDDHSVDKTVLCEGVLISDIVKSLCGEDGEKLRLSANWKIRYLEEDAYHANIPAYFDTLGDINGHRRPILALKKHEMFLSFNRYNRDDDGLKKPDEQSVYRNAGSANGAVFKKITGIHLFQDKHSSALYEYTIKMQKEDGTPIGEKTACGVLKGMDFAIRAPKLKRYTPADYLSESIIATAEGSAVFNFRYSEKPFVEIACGDKKTAVLLSGIIHSAKTVPASEEKVRTLVATGDAALLKEGEKTDVTVAKRNLYIDERNSAGGTFPYGYGKFVLLRYNGWSLKEFLQMAGIKKCRIGVIDATDINNKKISITDTENCFVAYRQTKSKGVPYNTAEHKRKATDFTSPLLINIYDGKIILDNVVVIRLISADTMI